MFNTSYSTNVARHYRFGCMCTDSYKFTWISFFIALCLVEKKSGCLDKRPPVSYRHWLYDQWYTGTPETKDKALQFSGRSYQTGSRLGKRILNKIR